MPNNLNRCNFIGHLGKDPEVRYMPNGEAVASFSIGVSEQWKNKSGGKEERTEWVNVTAFRKLAEICGEYLRKGSKVYVSGKMKTDKYTDKQGVEKYSTKIVIREMEMLDSKGGQKPNSAESTPAAQSSQDDGFDDDIPF